MAQLVRYKYGNYTHEAGEVIDFKYRETANMTKRWYRDTSETVVTLKVELQGCDWNELSGKIDALYAAYTQNDQLFQVLDENGAASTHWILDPNNANMMRGPFVEVIECPKGDETEMCNIRTFVIELKALFAAAESQLIYYEDSVATLGNCGLKWATQPVMSGATASYIVWPSSSQHIIQQGRSLGFSAYYSPDPSKIGGTIPVLPVNYEHLEQRVDRPLKPQRIGSGFWYYPWEWRYVFESVVDLGTLPPP